MTNSKRPYSKLRYKVRLVKVALFLMKCSIVFCRTNTLVVVHFMAPWAAQCQSINGVLKDLSELNDLKVIEKIWDSLFVMC